MVPFGMRKDSEDASWQCPWPSVASEPSRPVDSEEAEVVGLKQSAALEVDDDIEVDVANGDVTCFAGHS